jgi:hypothetical protein
MAQALDQVAARRAGYLKFTDRMHASTVSIFCKNVLANHKDFAKRELQVSRAARVCSSAALTDR